MPSDSRGFTLVELLVVVSIIALLVGLLLPALAMARRTARASACLSNVRSLQIASMMFAENNRGELIEPGLTEGALSDESVSWVTQLESYYDVPEVLRAPGDRSVHWPADEGGEGVPIPPSDDKFRRTSYGINGHVTRFLPVEVQPGDTPETIRSKYFNRMSKIEVPSRTVQFLLMAEEGPFAGADHVHPHEWHFKWNPALAPVRAATQSAIGLYSASPDSWNSISNYGYLDGHAETLSFERVYTSQDENHFDPRLYK
ncbi:MAG: type II secretion system protein [Phycisphaerales bacterium JB043]